MGKKSAERREGDRVIEGPGAATKAEVVAGGKVIRGVVRQRGSVTIKDIAAMAGVSVATVSYVVNCTRPVRSETRERVRAVIEATGYTRNISARNLRQGRTYSIGMVIPDLVQHTFGSISQGAEGEARARGFTMLFANSADDPAAELAAIQAFRERQVDGLIVVPVVPGNRGMLARMRLEGVPVVAVDRFEDGDVDYVGVETVKSMRMLTEHALDHGYVRIALVAGDTEVTTLAERRRGCVEAVGSSGLGPTALVVLEGARTVEEAQTSVFELLTSPNRPEAVIVSSFRLTMGVLLAVQEAKLRIPEDVALLAFDEFPYGRLFGVPITCVVQPAIEIGRDATRLIMRRIGDPDAPPVQMRLVPRVEYGASCGCKVAVR